jgi:hypothetical protein
VQHPAHTGGQQPKHRPHDHGHYHPNSKGHLYYTVIPFVSISAKFGICTVVGLNGTLAEKKLKYALETPKCAYFSFKYCPL